MNTNPFTPGRAFVPCMGRWFPLVACLFCPLAAPAQVITFTRIVDTSTAIPGGGGATFANLINAPPAIDNGVVTFRGENSSANI
jgi:hypothetical protein